LNMFAEMETLAVNTPSLRPETILRMATLNGARALGLAGQAGQLSNGALADVIALPCAGKPSAIYEEIVHYRGPVAASMIDGRWAIRRDE
jgi:cytosine/adenosine deaminase-related metal-dependent hydrolase